MMTGQRKAYTREFKLEAVKLIRDRGVSFARASRDLGVHSLWRWLRRRMFGSFTAIPSRILTTPHTLKRLKLRFSQAVKSARCG